MTEPMHKLSKDVIASFIKRNKDKRSSVSESKQPTRHIPQQKPQLQKKIQSESKSEFDVISTIKKPTTEQVESKPKLEKNNSLVLEVLKQNKQKLNEISSKMSKTDKGSKFKFDITRDNNGFISQVIVEKI